MSPDDKTQADNIAVLIDQCFDAELYFDVKDIQNLKLGEVINLIDKLQANDKMIETSLRFEE